MGDAIGQMLAPAVGIAISPVPLIAMVLMLATPRGRTNGVVFTVGWIVSLSLLVTAVVLLSAGADAAGHDDGPASWTYWLKLAFGVLFLLLGARQWRGRPRDGHGGGTPGWMRTIDAFTPAKAAGLAVALAVANPKNLVLAVSGAVSIAGSDATAAGRTVAVVLMVLIASLCTLAPLAVYLLGGDRSAQVLGGWKDWMTEHNAAVMATLLIVLGAKYVGDAVSGLTG
ncbi:GAP family protein [Streptomyces sp. NBC_00038]|uniref:GAP family protein n=1 Tax=Streptomyces sp. NBC_00038 TaxID=2903615 RepID=UPI0022570D0B|nr:GAP family protein [Streptomyces sp. NBC_00038]MCX5559768.1 GAP family protein [Streptomyces sp. NBC_00038]